MACPGKTGRTRRSFVQELIFMRVTGFNTTVVDLPLAKPIETAIHQMRSVGCVLLELETDQGLIGESYVFTLNGVRISSLQSMLESFAPMIKGTDPHNVNGLLNTIWGQINPIGQEGFSIAAMTALDVACWDLIGKNAEQPLHKLFGACRDEIKTYASGGLWLSQSIDELVMEANEFIEMGFRSIKIRLGSVRIEEDIQRVAAVREAIGPEIELLSDANQGLSAKHARRLGRELEKFQVGWFEEPVNYRDLKGLSELRKSLDIAVAGGETDYTHHGMHRILEAGALDVLMPDLQRMGGYTEMRRSAALASAHNVPISTHIFTEHSLCIGGSEPGCISVEHMPWFEPLFKEPMEIDNGKIKIPDRKQIILNVVKAFGDFC